MANTPPPPPPCGKKFLVFTRGGQLFGTMFSWKKKQFFGGKNFFSLFSRGGGAIIRQFRVCYLSHSKNMANLSFSDWVNLYYLKISNQETGINTQHCGIIAPGNFWFFLIWENKMGQHCWPKIPNRNLHQHVWRSYSQFFTGIADFVFILRKVRPKLIVQMMQTQNIPPSSKDALKIIKKKRKKKTCKKKFCAKNLPNVLKNRGFGRKINPNYGKKTLIWSKTLLSKFIVKSI